MDTEEKAAAADWLERVEELISVLEGSSISELELTEAGTEITIRRSPGMVLTAVPTLAPLANGSSAPVAVNGAKADKSVAVVAPLTGVYYAAASPTSSPFVNVGDIVHVGQVVALVEAMKVFNEVNAEVTGRVTSLVATSGNVVQKGDVLLRVEPS